MKRLKLTVAYDGTNYCGWQIQPNGITVEEVLNRALRKLTGEEITLYYERYYYDVFALNQRLPDDIVVIRSEEVPADWHPRYCNSKKTYEYHIQNAKIPDPTRRLTRYFVSFDLDIERMKKAAQYLVGTHDFVSFCNVRTDVEDTVRTIYNLDILPVGDEITIRIQGSGFLYNMVRIIVGTLVRVGRGFYTPEQVQEILEAKNRKAAGVTAPPQGLFLVGIEYEE